MERDIKIDFGHYNSQTTFENAKKAPEQKRGSLPLSATLLAAGSLGLILASALVGLGLKFIARLDLAAILTMSIGGGVGAVGTGVSFIMETVSKVRDGHKIDEYNDFAKNAGLEIQSK